ncbi:Zn-dependent protease with chaperone function [Granulicella pectinivorans]|uniref:Zn-dependent protease with chaperone function n=1 Tax=Granulicella pectinivorans TaxID=474950 RepID=A0A1I6LQE0_9BACT|nr:M48 family metallopeptidase [Granulicella pectinivorans]SFS05694.1 Zn-dependent protease with chaperone function [Granulicella pectinivorans]
MIRLRLLVLILFALIGTSTLLPAQTPATSTNDAYTLSPATQQKAEHYSHARIALSFVETGWGILQLLGILTLGIAFRMRNVAVNLSKSKWTQGAIFLLELFLLTGLLNLPLTLYRHHLAVEYGQSVQSWASWFADQAKSSILTYGIGMLMMMGLVLLIRKFPRRWWFAYWAAAMVFVLIGVFITPYVIDPLFNKFEPLQTSNPALVTQLEKVATRGGIGIPPERMFLMNASAKVTGMNAYVTGFGASKRVVVWDTTIAGSTPDEISFIFGHEMGHYRLNHIPIGLAFTAVMLLLGFFLMYVVAQGLLKRYGGVWRVGSQQDWGFIVILLLVVSIGSFLAEPIGNAFSRWEEHAADVYGLEAIHGLVPDPQATGQKSFQVLGETSLAEPHPSPFVVFWTYSHPSIQSRAQFARDYNPWVTGTPKYFKK